MKIKFRNRVEIKPLEFAVEGDILDIPKDKANEYIKFGVAIQVIDEEVKQNKKTNIENKKG